MNIIFSTLAVVLTMLITLSSAHADPEEATGSVADKATAVAQKVGNAVEHGVKAAANGVEHGAKAAAGGIQRGAKATDAGIKRGAKAAANGIEHGAEATGRAVDHVAEKLSGSSSTEK